MSSNLGALGSYALASQMAQIAATKMQIQAQQAVVDMLAEATDRMAAISETVGRNVDISI